MSVDYGEIVCTAVDQIINARLEGLQYNITKLCLIVDDSQRHKGEYIVSDGNARFQAFSTDKSFRNGNNVLVLIPNGDYNMQKTITGRVAATNTEPFNYTSPMDTMVQISGNVFENKETKGSLLANSPESNKIIQHIITVQGDDLTGLTGFTRLGITAGFRSWLNGLDVAEGTYGLKVYIYSEENHRYDLTFNNNDMYGNPYQFEDYFYQEKVFDISAINNIEKVEVYFYQDGNFKNGNGNNIPYQVNDELLGLQDLEDNLFVNNVAIYFGYDVSAFSGETLLLATENNLTYEYIGEKDGKIENPTVDIKLQWIHKVKEREYKVLKQEDINENYEIRWFKYNEGSKNSDYYAGIGWDILSSYHNSLLIENVELSSEKPYEEFKVVGIIKEIIEDKEIENVYYSNVLRFTNEKYTDESLINKSSGYAIEFEDGSKGNYFLYDQNGNILNPGVGQGYRRTAKVTYKGGDLISSDDFKIDYIYWYIPKETSSRMDYTMIITSNEYFTENDGDYWNSSNNTYKYSKTNWYGTDYIGVKRNNDNVKQSFSIGNHWNQQKANNTIRCIISINGIEYELASELKFGRAGTQGTNTTMVLEFVDNENAFIIGKTPQVQCILYNYNGERLNPNTGSYAWSWNDSKYFNDIKDSGNVINIVGKEILTSIPTDNYSILQCVYTPAEGMALTAYLPIAIKNENYSHIEGAKEVVYNHQGLPNYYNDVYKLYKINNDEKPEEIRDGCIWGLSKTVGEENDYPRLQNLVRAGETYQALAVDPFYMQSGNKTCVYAKKDNVVVWSQPILIMQSKYDFAMLNNWDGGLTIDEENGTILSTMLGAGRKNNNNTFSGVLIGDISAGTDNNEADKMTGVYGLHEGVISYALKEDGTATFGKTGCGQIKIDGNKGQIFSPNYFNEKDEKDIGEGMLIDLDDGKIHIKDNGFTKILIQPDSSNKKPYLLINGDSNATLINIEDKNYYLQSSDYYKNDGQTGTHFDLADGELIIKKPEVGAVYLSDKEGNLFKVQTKENQPLIVMRDKEYYLQSAKYEGKTQHTIKYNNKTYTLYNNTRTSLLNGEGEDKETISITPIVAIKDNEVYQINETTVDGKKILTPYESPIEFKKTTIVRTEAKDENDTSVNVVNITYEKDEYKNYFISQLSPKLINTSQSGLKMDLEQGYISGYDLRLNGINANNNTQQFILDSSAEKTPFSIGNKFKVDWDGTVYCENIKYLGTKPSDGTTVININDNFYVTASGGAGGSSANFGKGYFGGGYFGGSAARVNPSGSSDDPIATVSEDGTVGVGNSTIQGLKNYATNEATTATGVVLKVVGPVVDWYDSREGKPTKSAIAIQAEAQLALKRAEEAMTKAQAAYSLASSLLKDPGKG